MGVYEAISNPADVDFAVSVVLVPSGQSGQEYRVCMNLPAVNARIRDSALPLPDCQSAIDSMGAATLFSNLDIKAGFNNIPVAAASLRYMGMVTQDGLWRVKRMAFGFKTAPAHFQMVIRMVLG